MITTLKQWREQAAKRWEEALRDVGHAEALQDNFPGWTNPLSPHPARHIPEWRGIYGSPLWDEVLPSINVPMYPTETYYLRLREAQQAWHKDKDQPPNSNHSSNTEQLRRPDSV